MLANTHNISEQDNCHVHGDTLFNVMTRNELFSYKAFAEQEPNFAGDDLVVFHQIQHQYDHTMCVLEKLKEYEMYAVQGDLSDGNLFTTVDGKIGLFDFNNCGDNYLLSDAILGGIFLARLMDYSEVLTDELSIKLFRAFIKGYTSVRPFTQAEIDLIPYIYALTNAFWLSLVKYGDDCLSMLLEHKNHEGASHLLERIYTHLHSHIPIRTWLDEIV